MPEVEPWTCPCCAIVVDTHYCSTCGERPMRQGDLTLRGLLEQLFHALTSIDGRPAAVHAVFALHVYAFLLLLLCVGTTVPAVDLWLGGAGFASEPLDHAIALAAVCACALYLYFATATVYGTRGGRRALETVVLTVGMMCIVLGYRFALFLATLCMT